MIAFGSKELTKLRKSETRFDLDSSYATLYCRIIQIVCMYLLKLLSRQSKCIPKPGFV